MTHYFSVGDRSQAICADCGLVSTTFKYREVILDEYRLIKNVLVAVCDGCDKTVAIPNQSVSRISTIINKS